MKVAVYSYPGQKENLKIIKDFLILLRSWGIEYCIFEDLYPELHSMVDFPLGTETFLSKNDLLKEKVDFMISLGGDGTFLDTLQYVQCSDVPVMGINTGRLGFLATITRKNIEVALSDLLKGQYTIEERTLLNLESDKPAFETGKFALNDFTIHKRDTSSMLTIHTFLNGEFFNTYWSDGVIVTTPTGSTGYSLSCGGPIIFPDSKNFAITPVAPHNLNIRPVIVSDQSVVTFEVSGRGSNYLISLDSKSEIVDYSYQLAICKAPFTLKLVKLNRQNFIQTLREKLMWGLDNRNYKL